MSFGYFRKLCFVDNSLSSWHWVMTIARPAHRSSLSTVICCLVTRAIRINRINWRWAHRSRSYVTNDVSFMAFSFASIWIVYVSPMCVVLKVFRKTFYAPDKRTMIVASLSSLTNTANWRLEIFFFQFFSSFRVGSLQFYSRGSWSWLLLVHYSERSDGRERRRIKETCCTCAARHWRSVCADGKKNKSKNEKQKEKRKKAILVYMLVSSIIHAWLFTSRARTHTFSNSTAVWWLTRFSLFCLDIVACQSSHWIFYSVSLSLSSLCHPITEDCRYRCSSVQVDCSFSHIINQSLIIPINLSTKIRTGELRDRLSRRCALVRLSLLLIGRLDWWEEKQMEKKKKFYFLPRSNTERQVSLEVDVLEETYAN